MIRALLISLLMVAMVPAALAHRVHESLTEVTLNTRTGELEIAVRLYGHDLDFALVEGGMADTIAPGDESWLSAVDDYASPRLWLDVDGERADLSFAGSEREGQFVWVYYTLAQDGLPATLALNNQLLIESFPEQSNMINFMIGEGVRTVVQTASTRSIETVHF